MKKILYIIPMAVLLCVAACSKSPKIDVSVSDKYEGNTIEIITYLDSTVLASHVIENGHAALEPSTEAPRFTAIVIDGKTRAFYITEPGNATVTDSVVSATGTPMNDKFSHLIQQLDSVEQYDDMNLYLDFVSKSYEENKDNPIGDYFAVEILRYAEPEQVEAFLAAAPETLKNAPKVKRYEEMAKLRAATAPGNQFVDFEGEDEEGNPLPLSTFIKPGNYTIVDFWASWCPYCIKELPEIKSLYEEWKDKGVEIVGVAVRDLPEDTKGMVQKKSINWPVIYNAKTKPYDIYGFAGIPHHILIGPDGKIISRGESIEEINERLKNNLGDK